MVMIIKNKDRIPSASETDNDDKYTVEVSSRRSPLTLKLKKHGKKSSIGKLKNSGSKVPLTRELASQSPYAQNDSKAKYCQSDGSRSDLSHQDQYTRCDYTRVSNDSRIGPIKGEDGVETVTRSKANPWEIIDAACALMEMANDVSFLPKNGLHLRGGNRGANGMPNTKKLKGKLNSDKVCYDNCSLAYGKKAMLSEKFQRYALEDQMKEKEDAELHVPLLRVISLDRGKMKKRKVRNDSYLPQSKCVNDDYDLKSQKMLKEPPVSSSKKLSFKRVKAESAGSPFLERKTKPVKKLKFTLITPTVHTGFLFSIIHFLSAIRIAMVNSHAENDTLAFDKPLGKSSSPKGVCDSKQTEQKNLPCLAIYEIVEHVKSNPGDPRVLEEPLQDLIRGALKIFSSEAAPLGAKDWKALTFYDKSSKHWSWTGPVSSKRGNAIEEEIYPEAWGLPLRTLEKLVDAFANWLKSVQETLQQIRSLPKPPVTFTHSAADLKERFKSGRPRKCVATISPCSEEVRAYFRKEEALRYTVPEWAFSYTALDGRKSAVAPLKRCSGKPSLKTRDHFMLKANRPPQFTVLCLIRDAAARLPGSMGTRSDVCILVRDSQYIVEDVSDEQINQVVSGALDRLHYENDPCVQFNGDTKLWVYLHGEREEEDFEDDGTLSEWRR